MTWAGVALGFFFVMVFLAFPLWLGIAAKMYDRFDR